MKKKEEQKFIIIKKKRKAGHEASHNSGWKVAYADFVTAMMVFFLLLWLLNSFTEEQKLAVSKYFNPFASQEYGEGNAGILGGAAIEETAHYQKSKDISNKTLTELLEMQERENKKTLEGEKPEDAALEKAVEEKENQEFKKVEKKIKKEFENSAAGKKMLDNLLVDTTPEGLRIQIIDKDQRSMFPSGSAALYDYTRNLLEKVTGIIIRLPNKIAITGHTDAQVYSVDRGYSNWELSTDRANASRRILESAGLPKTRVFSVIGKADIMPFNPKDPYSPENRRITIVLLRNSYVQEALKANKAIREAKKTMQPQKSSKQKTS